MRIKSFLQSLKKIIVAESWIDIFVRWLHGLPLPYWLTCTMIGLALAMSVVWNSDDSLPFPEYFSILLTLPYGLFILWHLENDKRDLFSNLSNLHSQNTATQKSGFLYMFSKWFLILLRISSSLFFFLVILLGLFGGALGSTSSESINATILMIVILSAINTISLLAIKIGKILSSIYKLRSQQIDINLLDLTPLYKLSRTTRRIALYILPLSVALGLFITPRYIDALRKGVTFDPAANSIYVFFTSLGPLVILIATLAFLIPVFWIRQRIIETKSNALAEIGRRVQSVFREQDQYADQGDYAKVAHLKAYTEALISRRDFIKNISEWPWETRVFREFSIAVLIPLILWALQLYLARWLGN